jgi:hypothetical protein
MTFWKNIELRDVLLFIGFGCLVYGIELIYIPAAWVVAGLCLLGASWRMAK